MAIKIIISSWQKDQAFPVEHMNIIVHREHDREKPIDEYLTTIPVGCSRAEKLAVKFAYLSKMATSYPDCPSLFDNVDDQDFQEGDSNISMGWFLEMIRSH